MFFLGISLIYFTYYYKELPSQNIESQLFKDKNKIQIDANQEKISNTFENIEYNGIDLNGNRYNIKSKTADFEFENPELINMKVMFATFYFKDGTILKVEGDYGTYNNKNNNMEFRENIVAEYEKNYEGYDRFGDGTIEVVHPYQDPFDEGLTDAERSLGRDFWKDIY